MSIPASIILAIPLLFVSSVSFAYTACIPVVTKTARENLKIFGKAAKSLRCFDVAALNKFVVLAEGEKGETPWGLFVFDKKNFQLGSRLVSQVEHLSVDGLYAKAGGSDFAQGVYFDKTLTNGKMDLVLLLKNERQVFDLVPLRLAADGRIEVPKVREDSAEYFHETPNDQVKLVALKMDFNTVITVEGKSLVLTDPAHANFKSVVTFHESGEISMKDLSKLAPFAVDE